MHAGRYLAVRRGYYARCTAGFGQLDAIKDWFLRCPSMQVERQPEQQLVTVLEVRFNDDDTGDPVCSDIL